MSTTTRHRAAARRAVAALATVSLAAIGLAAVTAPTDAATLQSVRFSVSTGGPAYTSTPIRADFTIANPAANSRSLAAFTIVVPPGVGRVSGAGVSGPGNWRESVVPCGSVTSCSSLVLVYASLPLSSSLLRPGRSMTASISFTTPSAPRSIAFQLVGIGGGVFTTPDTPTINVIAGDAANFVLTSSSLVSPANVAVAGEAQSFTLQAQNVENVNVPYGPATVRVALGADDTKASLLYGANPPVLFAPTVDVALPYSATGSYGFSIVFRTAAAPSSVKVTNPSKPVVPGLLSPVTVAAAAPVRITFDTVGDISTGALDPALPNPARNQPFASTFFLFDAFDNYATATNVALTTTAGGVLGVDGSKYVAPTGVAPGSITATYDTVTPSLPLALTLPGGVAPNDVASFSTPVDGAGVSAIFVPNSPGTLTDLNCLLATTDPVCTNVALDQGANGAVQLVQQPCAGIDTVNGVCGKADNANAPVITYVKGDFGNLYNPGAPASVRITCIRTLCPHISDDAFTYNAWEESAEDYLTYPIFALPSDVPLTPSSAWSTVLPCQTTSNGSPATITEWNRLDSATTIPAGQQFCVDVATITRNTDGTGTNGRTGFLPGPHYGDLSFSVYFLTDPRLHI